MMIVGIDPGLKGGICLFDHSKNFLAAIEMPLRPTLTGKQQFEYDIPLIASLLKASAPDLVCLENVHSMPGQGVSSTFLFGKGFGILLGIIETLEIPLKLVTPRVWKGALGVVADKESSRLLANQLFPTCSAFWKLKKHDGLAEAALLSYWASTKPDLDLIVPGDIFQIYHIEVNKHVRVYKNSRRHHSIPSNTKNRRSRNSSDHSEHSSPGQSRSKRD